MRRRNLNSKFLINEEKRRIEEEKKKSDKHLFPITKFYDEEGNLLENIEMPYAKLDMIFNAKNIWANFQNPDPAHIKYNLHQEKQWRPFIFIEDDEEDKKQEKKKNKNANESSSSNDSEEEINSKSDNVSKNKIRDTISVQDQEYDKFKGMQEKNIIEYFKRKGISMREFAPFYDLKNMERIYTSQEIRK